MRLFILAVLLCLVIHCAACDTSSEHIELEGVIRRVNLEEGFWGIAVDDGRKFDPVNLPEKFKKDGLRVYVKLHPRDELAGLHMWGQVVEIKEIRPAGGENSSK